MAQNTVPFQAIERQLFDVGNVCSVHVIPSGLVAATVPAATAQNTVPFHAMEVQLATTV